MKKSSFFELFRKGKFTYTVLSLFIISCLLITSSFAWLARNRTLNSSDMNMSLAVDDTSALYRAYMYDMEKECGTDEDANGNELTVTNLDLNQYDTLFRAKNKYTPAFAKITIIGNESMPKDGTVHLTIERTADELLEGDINRYTSRIARFTAFIIPSKEDLEISDPNLLYNYINDPRYNLISGYTTDQKDSKTFVKIIGDGEVHEHERATSITISVDYESTYWYTNENGDDALNIYLYISYDVRLIDCYMKEELNNEISFMDAGIAFYNDFKKISISYDK